MAEHHLAYALGQTLAAINVMPVTEFRAWLAYFAIIQPAKP